MKLLFSPRLRLGDDHAFVSLHALAGAFNDVDVDDHGVARGERPGWSCSVGQFPLARGFGSGPWELQVIMPIAV